MAHGWHTQTHTHTHTHTHTEEFMQRRTSRKKEQKENMVFMCATEDTYVFLYVPTNSTIFRKYLEISSIDFYNNISAVSAVGVGEYRSATTVATKQSCLAPILFCLKKSV